MFKAIRRKANRIILATMLLFALAGPFTAAPALAGCPTSGNSSTNC